MEQFKVIGNEVLRVEVVETGTQTAIIRTHCCFANKIILSGPAEMAVNTPATVTAKILDWQDNPTETETDIRIRAVDIGISLTTSNGEAAFTFVAEEPGKYEIRAEAIGMDEGILEVVVI